MTKPYPPELRVVIRKQVLRRANIKWRLANTDKHLAAAYAWRDANPGRQREANRAAYARAKSTLSDYYVRAMITRISGLPAHCVPQNLIEAKRAQLAVFRLTKEIAK